MRWVFLSSFLSFSFCFFFFFLSFFFFLFFFLLFFLFPLFSSFFPFFLFFLLFPFSTFFFYIFFLFSPFLLFSPPPPSIFSFFFFAFFPFFDPIPSPEERFTCCQFCEYFAFSLIGSWHRFDELCGYPIIQNSLFSALCVCFFSWSQCMHNSRMFGSQLHSDLDFIPRLSGKR